MSMAKLRGEFVRVLSRKYYSYLNRAQMSDMSDGLISFNWFYRK